MSIQTELDRIIGAVESAHEKVAEKGGTTARPYLVANLASAIDTIPKATEPELQEKTVTPSTSTQSVLPDSGYGGLSKVTVNAMPTATQATPSISVSSGGLITASAAQSAGYVSSGTKSATRQLTTQAAKTVTPTKSTQTAVASERYTTGAVKVAPIPSNYIIPSGTISITKNGAVDVTQYANAEVNVSGGGGGGSVETCTVTILPDIMPSPAAPTYWYLDENFEPKSITTQNGSFTTVKNTLMVADTWSSFSSVSGNVSLLFPAMYAAAFYVTGDCSLMFSM